MHDTIATLSVNPGALLAAESGRTARRRTTWSGLSVIIMSIRFVTAGRL